MKLTPTPYSYRRFLAVVTAFAAGDVRLGKRLIEKDTRPRDLVAHAASLVAHHLPALAACEYCGAPTPAEWLQAQALAAAKQEEGIRT